MHYVGAQPSGIVVSDSADPAAVGDRSRPDVAAGASRGGARRRRAAERPKAVDEMVRPIAVDASGAELAGLSVAPEPGARADALRLPGAAREVSRLFGTDGVRGVANRELTPELALRIGRARRACCPTATSDGRSSSGATRAFPAPCSKRRSSPASPRSGRDAVSLGIVPTPAVACVTRATGAAAGVVISASHNPIADNGIKFFGSDGFKLSDELEDRDRSADRLARSAAADRNRGRHGARRAESRRVTTIDELYEGAAELHGLHVVVDGGFRRGLRDRAVRVAQARRDGHGDQLRERRRANQRRMRRDRSARAAGRGPRARSTPGERRVVGVAFDGDADRALFVDETGAVVSGDHVMFALGARDARARRARARRDRRDA